MGGSESEDLLMEVVRRRELLDALADSDSPMRRSRLCNETGVSSSTAYRAVTSLEEKGVVESQDDGYILTPYGRVLHSKASELGAVAQNGKAARYVLNAASGTGLDMDPGAFVHADVTVSEPELPYEPARRFVELFEETETLRLLAVSSATPMFSRDVHRLILDGKETEVVCPETIVEANVEKIPDDEVSDILQNLSVRVHDDPPFTVALFDDKVGVGKHDDDKGTLDVFVDTDDANAYSWGEDVYEMYRDEAEPFV